MVSVESLASTGGAETDGEGEREGMGIELREEEGIKISRFSS